MALERLDCVLRAARVEPTDRRQERPQEHLVCAYQHDQHMTHTIFLRSRRPEALQSLKHLLHLHTQTLERRIVGRPLRPDDQVYGSAKRQHHLAYELSETPFQPVTLDRTVPISL